MITPIGNQPPLSPLPTVIPFREVSFMDVLPFATFSSEEIEFSAKTTYLQQRLSKEVDNLLREREGQIDTHLQGLEAAHQDHKVVRALLDVQGWAHEYAHTANEAVHEGVSFLEGILPKFLIEKGEELEGVFHHLEDITHLGGNFLAALDNGAKGLAMVSKGRILKETAKVLVKLKANYKEHKLILKRSTQGLSKEAKALADKTHLHELKQMKKAIHDLKKKLKKEEEDWEKAQGSFTKKTVKTTFISLKYIVAGLEGIFTFAKHLSTAVYTTSNALGLYFSFSALRKELKNNHKFDRWINRYQSWKKDPLSTPEFDNKAKFLKELQNLKTIEEVRERLNDIGFKLEDGMILAKFHLMIDKDVTFKEELAAAYKIYQNSLSAFEEMIQTSKDLLAKRKAVLDKKMFIASFKIDKLMPKIEALKEEMFVNTVQAAFNRNKDLTAVQAELNVLSPPIVITEKHLLTIKNELEISPPDKVRYTLKTLLKAESKSWLTETLKSTEKEALLKFYIDHHETLEMTTKNALVEMIDKKLALSKEFIKFKLNESVTFFSMSLAMAIVSASLWIIGLVTAPVAGAGLIFLGLSVPTVILTVAFLVAGLILNLKRHPQLMEEYKKGTGIKLLYASLRSAIAEYGHASKQKKLLETASIIRHLHLKTDLKKDDPAYHHALEDYKKAKIDYQVSQEKIDHWYERLKTLKDKLSKANWKDFAGEAQLKIASADNSFDSLEAFNDALNHCDLNLMDPKTSELLEVHLGMDLEETQKNIDKNPILFKNSLQKFCTMAESNFIDFIKTQEHRLEKSN